MTQKILVTAVSIFILQLSSFGQQACTPDPTYSVTTTLKGIHPDTLVNLAQAYVGVPYSQTLTLVIPKDTVNILTFKWDSTVAKSFTGMPASLSYACWNQNGIPAKAANCSWKGNSIGCVIITGTPLLSEVGTRRRHHWGDKEQLVNLDIWTSGDLAIWSFRSTNPLTR